VSTCQVCSALSVSPDPDEALGERKSWEAVLESLHSQGSFRNHRLDHGALSTGIESEDPVRRPSGEFRGHYWLRCQAVRYCLAFIC